MEVVRSTTVSIWISAGMAAATWAEVEPPFSMGGRVLAYGAIIVLAFLPWLDTSRVRSGKYRPIFKVCFWLFVLSCLGLGWLGAQEPSGGYVIAARLLALYYFGFFLVLLPILGLVETPRTPPASIAEAVLRGKTATIDQH